MSQMVEHQLIRTIPLFTGLPQQEIQYLAKNFQLLSCPEQEELIHEGSSSDRFFILLEGIVDIVKAAGTDSERTVATRGPGSLIGEMSIFSLDGLHTASVRAASPVKLLAMKRGSFESLLKRQPDLAYDLARTMSSRLVQSENSAIIELREKNRRLAQAYQELKEAQARLVEQEKLEHELEIARQIQHSILPKSLPEVPGYEFGALISPARAVGGDFYDFIPLAENRLGIVVGDVSDKGIPAALFMSLVYSQMRSEARRHLKPGAVLAAVNRSLNEIDVVRMYVTMVYGILELEAGRFTFARAGHPLPIVLDEGHQPLTLSEGIGQPLSMLAKPRFDEQSVLIPQGGSIMLFTDGVTEASDAQDILYETDAFLHDLHKYVNCSAQEVCDRIFADVIAHSGSGPQQDDITLLCIKH